MARSTRVDHPPLYVKNRGGGLVDHHPLTLALLRIDSGDHPPWRAPERPVDMGGRLVKPAIRHTSGLDIRTEHLCRQTPSHWQSTPVRPFESDSLLSLPRGERKRMGGQESTPEPPPRFTEAQLREILAKAPGLPLVHRRSKREWVVDGEVFFNPQRTGSLVRPSHA